MGVQRIASNTKHGKRGAYCCNLKSSQKGVLHNLNEPLLSHASRLNRTMHQDCIVSQESCLNPDHTRLHVPAQHILALFFSRKFHHQICTRRQSPGTSERNICVSVPTIYIVGTWSPLLLGIHYLRTSQYWR